MTRKLGQAAILLAILAAAFTVIVFVIPFPKGGAFWIAYLAELLAIGLQIPFFCLSYKNGETEKKQVLGLPVLQIGLGYLGLQTIFSIIIFVMSSLLPQLRAVHIAVLCTAAVGSAVLLAAALICCLLAHGARNTIEKVEAAGTVSTGFMLDLRTCAENLAGRAADPTLKRELEKLAEDLRYSDPVSSPKIAAYEKTLAEEFSALSAAVQEARTEQALACCRNTGIALKERNAACKRCK